MTVLELLWQARKEITVQPGEMRKDASYDLIIRSRFPELWKNPELLDIVLVDLRTRGLCAAQEIIHRGVSHEDLTKRGIDFLDFVRSPEELH